MAILTIKSGQKVACLEFAAPKSLKQLLEEANVQQPHPCGGRGTCKKCTVVLDGIPVLACRTTVSGDAQVLLPVILE